MADVSFQVSKNPVIAVTSPSNLSGQVAGLVNALAAFDKSVQAVDLSSNGPLTQPAKAGNSLAPTASQSSANLGMVDAMKAFDANGNLINASSGAVSNAVPVKLNTFAALKTQTDVLASK
jgi:hypothetical protein